MKDQILDLWIQLTKEKIYTLQTCSKCKTCIYSKEYYEDTKIFKEAKERLGLFWKCKNLNLKRYTTPKRNYCQYYMN